MNYESLFNSISSCRDCSFYNNEYQPIPPTELPGETRVMLIGEHPTWEENQLIPFAENTKRGEVLDKYLQQLNLKREDIWITDFVKCRFPKCALNNYDKYKGVIDKNSLKCAGLWLLKEVQYIKPEIIITLSEETELIQRFAELFKLKLPVDSQKLVGKLHQISINGRNCLLCSLIYEENELDDNIPQLKEYISAS